MAFKTSDYHYLLAAPVFKRWRLSCGSFAEFIFRLFLNLYLAFKFYVPFIHICTYINISTFIQYNDTFCVRLTVKIKYLKKVYKWIKKKNEKKIQNRIK